MKPKKKKTLFWILVFALGNIFGLWFMLHLATLASINNYGFGNALTEALATFRFLKEPFRVFPMTSIHREYCIAYFIIFNIGMGYIAVWDEVQSKMMIGKEHGTAKWNDNIKKYMKKYAPEPRPIKKKEYKKIFQTLKSMFKNKDFKGLLIYILKGLFNYTLGLPVTLFKKFKNRKNKEVIKEPDDRMILSKQVKLSMNRQRKRNSNIIVYGASGTGKSRYFIKPNILQANANYVITDPAGELLASTGHFLETQGYSVRVFNTVDMQHSNRYNPFRYLQVDTDVIKTVYCFIKNTTGEGKKGDEFWEKCEINLFTALMFYLWKTRPVSEQHFGNIIKLIQAAEVDENDASKKSKLDLLFEELPPEHIAVKYYKNFKSGSGKTLKGILISCLTRAQFFQLDMVNNLVTNDNIHLEDFSKDKKVALFVITPTADTTYNFLVAMMYSQIFRNMYEYCTTDKEAIKRHNRLPRNLRFLLDEFANIAEIPDFSELLSTMRKFGISCTIVYQNLGQTKKSYEKNWGSIIDGCDSFVFLGGTEPDLTKYISQDVLGTTTITTRSQSTGKKGGSNSYSRIKRELMTETELQNMNEDYCVVRVRGINPFFDLKYDYLNHENYKYTGDANPEYIFTIDEDPRYDVSNMKEFSNAEMNKELEEAKEIISDPKSQHEIAKEISKSLKKEDIEKKGINEAIKSFFNGMFKKDNEEKTINESEEKNNEEKDNEENINKEEQIEETIEENKEETVEEIKENTEKTITAGKDTEENKEEVKEEEMKEEKTEKANPFTETKKQPEIKETDSLEAIIERQEKKKQNNNKNNNIKNNNKKQFSPESLIADAGDVMELITKEENKKAKQEEMKQEKKKENKTEQKVKENKQEIEEFTNEIPIDEADFLQDLQTDLQAQQEYFNDQLNRTIDIDGILGYQYEEQEETEEVEEKDTSSDNSERNESGVYKFGR